MNNSKEAIEIKFDKAITQAQELEDIAMSLLQLANGINGRELMKIEKSWKGSNSDALTMRWRELTSNMLDTAQELDQISKSIRYTADIVYKAEKAACLLAYY